MTWAIFEIVYARGFDDGYHDGCLEQTQY
jgi:hypothetical protein